MEKLSGTIRTKAIPSSDWFLAMEIKKALLLRDMRDVLILGVRAIYGEMQDAVRKQTIIALAEQLRSTDLDTWQRADQPIYDNLA